MPEHWGRTYHRARVGEMLKEEIWRRFFQLFLLPHPSPLCEGWVRYHLLRHLIFTRTISHPRHGQVSGHDFSALPDTSVASEGCIVVPKRAQERFLPCAAGGRAAQRSDNSFQQFRPRPRGVKAALAKAQGVKHHWTGMTEPFAFSPDSPIRRSPDFFPVGCRPYVQ
jgi:hypothetical protein